MYTLWTKNLSEEDKKQWVIDVQVSQSVLKKFKEVLNINLIETRKVMKSRDSYDSVDWPYFIADNIGEQRAYEKAIKLLDNLINE